MAADGWCRTYSRRVFTQCLGAAECARKLEAFLNNIGHELNSVIYQSDDERSSQ